MKTTTVRTATRVAHKRGMPKEKAKPNIGNLFNLEEEEIDQLFPEDKTDHSELIISSAPESVNTLTPSEANDPVSVKETSPEVSKKTNRNRRRKNTPGKGKSEDGIKSTEDLPNNLFQYGQNTFGSISQESDVKPEDDLEVLPFETTYGISNSELCSLSFSNETADMVIEAGGSTRSSSEIQNQPKGRTEEFEEYSFELSNEEIDKIPENLSLGTSKDLALDLDEEFFIEPSALEFGDDCSSDDKVYISQGIDDVKIEQEERAQARRFKLEKDSGEQVDEPFDLPDNCTSVNNKAMEVKYRASEIEEDQSHIRPQEESSKEGHGLITIKPNLIVKNPSLDNLKDDQFDIDEIINAGTNSYSPPTNNQRCSSKTQCQGAEEHEDCAQTYTDNIHKDTILIDNNLADNTQEDNIQANCLPFGKTDLLQEIIQAWAYGDLLALINLGQETSLEDEPFYSGDDQDYSSTKNNTSNKVMVLEEQFGHPLARYGLKVRTINALELVGEKNYYSLTEDSRKELELMVQDLSKTEEGSVRNLQLKQSIFSMFN